MRQFIDQYEMIMDIVIIVLGMIISAVFLKLRVYPKISTFAVTIPSIWVILKVCLGYSIGGDWTFLYVALSVLMLVGLCFPMLRFYPHIMLAPTILSMIAWAALAWKTIAFDGDVELATQIDPIIAVSYLFMTLHYLLGIFVVTGSAEYIVDMDQ